MAVMLICTKIIGSVMVIIWLSFQIWKFMHIGGGRIYGSEHANHEWCSCSRLTATLNKACTTGVWSVDLVEADTTSSLSQKASLKQNTINLLILDFH